MNGSALDRPTALAFLGLVVIGGLNGVGVRLSNEELDFLWGAGLRFSLASLLLFGLAGLRGVPLPRGGALVSSVLYGIVGFAIAYGFNYYGLIDVPASVGMVILALVPLLTLLLAVLHGLETLRLQGLAGALLALGGVALLFWERLTTTGVPLLSLLAVVIGAVAIAETGVIVKRFPRPHPIVNNAIAMGVGGLALVVVSALAGQSLALPTQPATITALVYLVLLGSVLLFMLFLYVIERWTASATSYSLLLMPLPAAIGGAVLLGEPITAGLIVGGAIILAGVYLGVFAPPLSIGGGALLGQRPVPATDAPEPGPPPGVNPGCP